MTLVFPANGKIPLLPSAIRHLYEEMSRFVFDGFISEFEEK